MTTNRICLICGKPDWCSYTPDGRISFCARLSEGADRVSRQGWGVFFHKKSLFDAKLRSFPSNSPFPKAELAPVEIRNFVYQKLIELSPATNAKEIIDGPKGLRERKILDFENYGSLPESQTKRNKIAKIIRQLLNQEFPDFVRSQKSGLAGLPGFWIDKCGNSRLWLEKDVSKSMLLIPYRDPHGFIQACQIRLMGHLRRGMVRYLWLSTPKNNGITSGSPLHFGTQFSMDKRQTILLTEGALKAATTQIFLPELMVIASAGVSCSHDPVIQFTRHRPLLIAFDNDYHRNRQVARQLTHLINLRLKDSRIYGYASNLKILIWSDLVKGIDDALINQIPIESKSPVRWLESLQKPGKDQADKTKKNNLFDSFSQAFEV